MIEREHTNDRSDRASELDRASSEPMNKRPEASSPLESDVEFERQLEISRGVQSDFQEVLAVLSR